MPSNENSPFIKRPDNRSTIIWRYMSTEKYLYLICFRKLFFSRADKLDDNFEGSWTKLDAEKRRLSHEKMFSPKEGMPKDFIEKDIENMMKIQKNMTKKTFLNCWHVNTQESLAMWQTYGALGKAIVIQSTYETLHNCVDERVTLGLVEYKDYENESFFDDQRKAASPFYFKRKAYEYEKELRASIQRMKWGVVDPNEQFDENEKGMEIDIDVNKLIGKVIVSPKTADWLFEILKAVTKKYEYKFSVEKSILDANPLFI